MGSVDDLSHNFRSFARGLVPRIRFSERGSEIDPRIKSGDDEVWCGRNAQQGEGRSLSNPPCTPVIAARHDFTISA